MATTQADEPWCVFVSGSRDLTWDAHWVLVKEHLRRFRGPHSVLIHGAGPGGDGAVGCDWIADRAGHDLDFAVYAFPALWKLWNKSAGPIRNRLCVDVWSAFGDAGYRLAMLGFSTGGTGTEGALELARRAAGGVTPALIERIPVTL